LGFAYIAVAKQFYQLKWLIAVFTIEKLIYATHWTNWMLHNKIADVIEKYNGGIFLCDLGSMIGYFFCFFFDCFHKD
jgi:hypothetical protein